MDHNPSRGFVIKTGVFSISVKAIDRIMSGTVTQQRQEMSYQEFVWFILSEEDKGTSTAAEFWFRIMDRDGDGVITLEDLEFFYKEQVSQTLQSCSLQGSTDQGRARTDRSQGEVCRTLVFKAKFYSRKLDSEDWGWNHFHSAIFSV